MSAITTNPEAQEIDPVSTGEQTQITEKVIATANGFPPEMPHYLKAITEFVHALARKSSTRFTSERTAEQVIISKYFSGCHEAGIVWAVLLRAKGIPTQYIQALNVEAVRNLPVIGGSFSGHVFLRAEIDGKKVIINSTSGEITDKIPDSMIIGAEGLDSWDINLRTQDDMEALFKRKQAELLLA